MSVTLRIGAKRTMTGTTTTDAEEEKQRKDEECGAIEHKDKFNPAAYLDSFYKTASEDTAMQIVLFFLPGILYRLPQKVRSVLDLGAGPTVYLPIALRDRAENIYTSDYAPANREALISWIENRSEFDWNNVCSWIANIEASMKTGPQMQEDTRKLMRAVLDVNVHETPVVQKVVWSEKDETQTQIPEKFQVVSTVFCLEYSCETLDAYFRAVRSACSLIEDGGFLIQGGVLDATTYNFGGKTFRCHRLKQAHIVESLKANNMSTTAEQGYKFITHDDIFLLISKKLASAT
uniref:Nicotinamide N-methyltransferase n=1 Tax=Caenorhabditis japonica TaxID=281687 RepID=A0A8R1I256_CAEJA